MLAISTRGMESCVAFTGQRFDSQRGRLGAAVFKSPWIWSIFSLIILEPR